MKLGSPYIPRGDLAKRIADVTKAIALKTDVPPIILRRLYKQFARTLQPATILVAAGQEDKGAVR
jgi:hypothetical protein